MKLLKIGFVLSAFSLLLLSCKTLAQNTKIQSVEYTNTYGKGGFSSINANKDSLEASAQGGRTADFPNFKKKINQKDWEKLISGIDISLLEKTQNGDRRGIFDGNDEIFRIVTTEKEYEIINASADSENYKQLEQLKTKLNNLLSQYK